MSARSGTGCAIQRLLAVDACLLSLRVALYGGRASGPAPPSPIRVPAPTVRGRYLLVALNWGAFCGYGAILASFYLPPPGAVSTAAWRDVMPTHGNMLGDVCWTLEPLLDLSANVLIGRCD